MEFKSNVDFRESSGGQGSQPLKVPDITPLMRDNLNTELSEIKNSGAQALQALKAKNQMLQNNLKTEDGFTKIAGLTKFSQTLQNQLVQFAEQKKKSDIEEGMNLAYMQPASEEDLVDFYEQEKALFNAETKINDAAYFGVAKGAPYSAADRLKSLSGWKAYGFALSMADQAIRGREGWLSERMSTDNQTQIRVAGRDPFTPATARTPAEKAAARAKLNAQYENATGLSSIDNKFKQARVYPKFREQDAKQDQVWARQYNIDLSFVERQDALQEFLAHGNLSQLLNRYRSTVDNNNDPLGYSGAWKIASKDFQLLVQQKKIETTEDIDKIFNQPIPGRNGKTFKQEYQNRYQEVSDFLRSYRLEEYRIHQAHLRMKEETDEQNYREIFIPGQVSEARIKDLQAKHLARYGRRSQYLDNLSNGFSVDDLAQDRWNDEAEARFKAHQLTPDFVATMPTVELQQRWMNLAQQQYKERFDTNKFETAKKAFKGLVATYIKPLPDGTSTFEGAYLYQGLMRQFLKEFDLIKVTPGMSSEMAEAQAANNVKQLFVVATKDPNSPYYKGTSAANPFPNLFATTPAAKQSMAANKLLLQRIYSNMNNASTRDSFIKKENSILSKEELKAAAEGFGSSTWRVHPLIAMVADTYRMNPLDLMNQLLDANGLTKMKMPVQKGLDNLTNQQRNLLYNSTTGSSNRFARGASSTGTYINRYLSEPISDAVVKAATEAGHDPSLMAGLASVESTGDPFAVNPDSGATGLYQIHPPAHPQLTYEQMTDPVFASKYANKILKEYSNQYGGDIIMGLAIYGGYGNFANPREEALKEYIPKVIKRAMEFGYKGPLIQVLKRKSSR